jgi:hypothetical protein
MVLAVVDQLVRNTVDLDADQVHLFEDGTLRISGGKPASQAAAEAGMRQLLEALLETSTAVPPALRRAAGRAPGSELGLFVRELEVALVPTNRGAAKRALARLCREAMRGLARHPEIVPECVESARQPEPLPESPIPSVPVFVQEVLPEAVVDIPDLELPAPIPKKPPQMPPLEIEAVATAAPATDALLCEPIELCDADLESVHCPDVCVEHTPAPKQDTQCVLDDSPEGEGTAPFPLTRTTKDQAVAPAAPPTLRKTNGRLRFRPVFRAIQVDPDLTMPILAAPLESSENVAATSPVLDRPTPAESDTSDLIGSPRPPMPYSGTAARVEEPKRVTGPHQFVAPARFAKKTSQVTERISQFARGNQITPDDVVVGLEKISSDTMINDAPPSNPGASTAPTGEAGALSRGSHRRVG